MPTGIDAVKLWHRGIIKDYCPEIPQALDDVAPAPPLEPGPQYLQQIILRWLDRQPQHVL